MRRRVIAGLMLAAGLAAGSAGAQTFPSKSITLVVPFTAGGPTDTLARILAERMGRTLGQTVIVENTTGAAGTLGVARVVRAAPDGYTIGIGHWSTHVVNPAIYPLKFDILDDLEPLAAIATNPQLLVTRKDLPATDLKGLIEWAKAHSDKVTAGTAGVGAASHIGGLYFEQKTGAKLRFIPYRGGAPALTDLLGGQVQVMFDTLPTSVEHIRSGRVQALGVSSATRSEAIPNVPPVSDVVSGYDASGWYGIGAPKDTPRDIADKLNAEINAAIAEARLKQRLSELGGVPLTGPSTNFARIIADDTAKWAEVVKFSGAKAD